MCVFELQVVRSGHLGDEVGVAVAGLPDDQLHVLMWLQLLGRFSRIWFLLHKVQQGLHLPPRERQHRVQVVYHTV